MPEARDANEPQLLKERPARQRIDIFFMWFPRVALAAAFLVIGRSKFLEHSVYVRIFERIGLGVWFRYFTGTLQIAGSILVLIPRTFLVGIAMIGCTLLGAVLVWFFILGSAGSAIIPGAILAIVIAIGWRGIRR